MQALFKTTTKNKFKPTNGKVIIQVAIDDRTPSTLILESLQPIQQKAKEIYNLCKIIAVSDNEKDFKVGQIVSLYDEMFDEVPDYSSGSDSNGNPKNGYITLGKLLPYYFTTDKMSKQSGQDLTFLIPTSLIIAVLNDD